MKLKLGISLISALTLTVSCGDDDEEAAAAGVTQLDAPFMVASDVATPSSLVALDQATMLANLKASGHFVNNGTSSSEESTDEVAKCFSEKFDLIKVSATETTVAFGAEVNVQDCLELTPASDGQTVVWNSATIKLYTETSCSSADFTNFDGLTTKELAEEDEESCASGSVANLYQQLVIADAVITDADGTEHAYKLNNGSFVGRSDLTSATGTLVDSGVTYSDGNIALEFDNSSYDGTVIGQYNKATTADSVTGSTTGTYFTSGKFSVVLNDWTGDVTNVNASTAPTYSLTKSGATTPVTGSLSLTAGSGSSSVGAVKLQLLNKTRALLR